MILMYCYGTIFHSSKSSLLSTRKQQPQQHHAAVSVASNQMSKDVCGDQVKTKTTKTNNGNVRKTITKGNETWPTYSIRNYIEMEAVENKLSLTLNWFCEFEPQILHKNIFFHFTYIAFIKLIDRDLSERDYLISNGTLQKFNNGSLNHFLPRFCHYFHFVCLRRYQSIYVSSRFHFFVRLQKRRKHTHTWQALISAKLSLQLNPLSFVRSFDVLTLATNIYFFNLLPQKIASTRLPMRQNCWSFYWANE
jgi:hypothetical protein